jgi:ribosomal protein L7/L12
MLQENQIEMLQENQIDEIEYTTFDVILKNAGGQQFQVFKIVKDITGLGLKEAKTLIETVPALIKESVTKDEAKSIKKQLVDAGAEVELKGSTKVEVDVMDFGDLGKLSKQQRNNIKGEIWNKYNVGDIAKEIKERLRINSENAAKEGENSAYYNFTLWKIEFNKGSIDPILGRTIIPDRTEKKGILVNSDNRWKEAEIIFELVRENIPHNNIVLELKDYEYNGGTMTVNEKYIGASVKW